MNFRVGMKVVRVRMKQRPWPSYTGEGKYTRPEVGEVCTIKTINKWSAITLLTFVEHDNSHLTTNGYEPGFDAKCFRRVVERKTDISVFKKLLVPSRQRELSDS
jgi:hypothetical protein